MPLGFHLYDNEKTGLHLYDNEKTGLTAAVTSCNSFLFEHESRPVS